MVRLLTRLLACLLLPCFPLAAVPLVFAYLDTACPGPAVVDVGTYTGLAISSASPYPANLNCSVIITSSSTTGIVHLDAPQAAVLARTSTGNPPGVLL